MRLGGVEREAERGEDQFYGGKRRLSTTAHVSKPTKQPPSRVSGERKAQ